MMTDLDKAFDEVEERCSEQTYQIVAEYIQELLDEINYLEVEIEAISSAPKKKRRKADDDWE